MLIRRFSEYDNALYVLDRLKILSVSHDYVTGGNCYVTNPFCKSLRQALTGSGNHQSFGVPAAIPDEEQTPLKVLGDFATEQWEALLYYVVGSSTPGGTNEAGMSEGTKKLLREAQFVQGTSRSTSITAKGFDFLLQDINAQVWSLLIEYINLAEDQLGMNKVNVLSFLFTVGSLEIGQDYSMSTLTREQREVLNDLHNFGLVYLPTNANYFYPTPIAACITSESSMAASGAFQPISGSSLTGSTTNEGGFIVVETNYRIYAYTSSNLQTEILNLFTRLSTRYPNMVTGRLTKESIQRAIGLGITSQQIISYLTTHAHPVMGQVSRNNASGYSSVSRPTLPPTVVDQIRLWQIEGDRMKTTPGYLFRDFVDRKEYTDIVTYADECGVLIWKSDEKQRFFASRTEQLSKFIANRNAKRQAAANGK